MVTGFLHPGMMGVTVAAACRGGRLWAADGRSAATAARAAEADLTDAGTVAELTARSDVVVSICPPDAALDQAAAVAALGFAGTYIAANAISPATARQIAAMFDDYVDGGIIGPPAKSADTTRLYLSGQRAADVAELWNGSILEVRVIDGPAGAASAVKMCFAAWTKGTASLLLAIRALAEAEGVTEDIVGEWSTSMPHLLGQADATAAGVASEAWRFAGEMEEIASTFAGAGLPDGFHLAAADIYERLAGFKDRETPTLADVVETVLKS